jgi:hypothetical protein
LPSTIHLCSPRRKRFCRSSLPLRKKHCHSRNNHHHLLGKGEL